MHERLQVWTVKSLSKSWVKQQNGRSFSAAIAGQAWALGRIGDEAAQQLLKCLIQRLQTTATTGAFRCLSSHFKRQRETERQKPWSRIPIIPKSEFVSIILKYSSFSTKSICMCHPQDGVLSIALLHSSWIPVDCCRYASCCSSFNDLGFCTASFAFTSRFRGRSAGDVGPNGSAGCVLDPMGLGQTTLSTEQLGSETRPMVTMVITWCEYCTLGLCYNATKTSCNVHGDLVQSFSGEDAFSYSTGWTCCESCFLLIRNKLCDTTLTEITPSMLSFHSGFLLGLSCLPVAILHHALPQDISNMLWALATLNISTTLSQRCVDEAPLERLHGQVRSRPTSESTGSIYRM